MKLFLALIGGFAMSLGMFVAGLGVAVYFLAVEPVKKPSNRDASDLWAGEPRVVDPDTQDFVRVAAADTATVDPASPEQAASDPVGASDAAEPAVDTIVTGAVEPAPRENEAPSFTLPQAHVQWCEDRYRSYRPETNSYRPYSGGQRPCVSPYLREAAAPGAGLVAETPNVRRQRDDGDSSLIFYAADGGNAAPRVDARHARDCASRYRSYRASDNTYQPYGGGPRRQCQ